MVGDSEVTQPRRSTCVFRLTVQGGLYELRFGLQQDANRLSNTLLLTLFRMADELICPLNEIFHVRCIGMAAVVLPPGQLSAQQTFVD
jgi:hypothetical protein